MPNAVDSGSMNRTAFHLVVVIIMLTSLMGQALASTFNPALIAHELEHDAASSVVNASPVAELRSLASADHDHEHDHDGKFDETAHQLLHAAHHLQLFALPDFSVTQPAVNVAPAYAVTVSSFLVTSPEPLLRPPRPSFVR